MRIRLNDQPYAPWFGVLQYKKFADYFFGPIMMTVKKVDGGVPQSGGGQ